MTPLVADQVMLPDSNPALPSFWPEQLPDPEIVQLNEAVPLAAVVSVAFATTE
jgi:hypothetical protein